MKILLTGLLVLVLAACGGGGGGGGGGEPVLRRPETLPELPSQHPQHAVQAPLVDRGDFLHIGAIVQDGGVPAQRVVEYLQKHVGDTPSIAGEEYTFQRNTVGLARFEETPVIRLATGTDTDLVEGIVQAVQLVNTALPYGKKLVLRMDAPPLAGLEDIPDGQIFVDFAAEADWNLPNRDYRPNAGAIAESQPNAEYNHDAERLETPSLRAGHVWFNTTSTEFDKELIPTVMVHELLHVLGFLAHVDQNRFEDSIMRDSSLLVVDQLPTIDGEALLAAYTKFEAGTLPEELSVDSLGPWQEPFSHLEDTIGDVSMGVASRNGLSHPWASGPKPWMLPRDNPIFEEHVTWTGRLLGRTPADATVTGNAELGVDLPTLGGDLDFTELRSLNQQWSDGDLSYDVLIHGNTFIQNGGDEGVVTGAFFGRRHEGMGGVLEREDLTAAFGETR